MRKSLLSILSLCSLALNAMEEVAVKAPSLKNFVLISAPGSGKGTFSQYLVEKYGYVQVCIGDIFRAEIKAQTELGKKIKPAVDRGDNVDEEITCQLVADNLTKITSENKPFIIDGFPRTTFSFEFLRNHLNKIHVTNTTCFLQFIASDDVCIKRISGRLVCGQCDKVYNTDSAQPKKQNICDDCDIELGTRTADTTDIAQSRVKGFHQNTEPLMQNASQYFKTETILTERSLQELYTEYDKLVKEQ